MDELIVTLEQFRFLRPVWLLPGSIVILFWWYGRARVATDSHRPDGIAEHLARALTVGRHARRRFMVIDSVALTLVLISIAIAGPAWNKVPNPLVVQTAPLAIVFSQTKSMEAPDPAPSRVERAKYKLNDLLEGRAGARTSLIAYAGSAHRVVPLTEDPQVIVPFLEGLSPDIMPVNGNNIAAALKLSLSILAKENQPGVMLFVLDRFQQSDAAAFKQLAVDESPPVVFYAVGASSQDIGIMNSVNNATVIELTLDNSDINQIERSVALAYQNALARDDRLQWDDKAWLFAWPALLLTLLYFRRGWTMRWNVSLVLLIFLIQPEPVQAKGIVDLFLTPDQQAKIAFDRLEWDEAAELFVNQNWKAYALYTNGKYEEAAAVYRLIDGADAAFDRGMALVKSRQYAKGIKAFEQALVLRPDFAKAQRNLDISRAILEYVEQTREAQDTREGSEGADDIVFDKESTSGIQMQVTTEKKTVMQTEEQWMRTVDTRAEQFLKLRFQLEASIQ